MNLTRWLLLFAVLTTLLGSFWLLKKPSSSPNERSVPVETRTATEAWWQDDTTVQGQLSAETNLDIHAERSGILAKIYVHPGETVQGGQALLEIERGALASELEQAPHA